jgi:t-SNARE complex subunit (syntaxin)
MRKQLEQMGTELRELMIYQSPTELGALYTEVEEMMKQLGAEQNILIAQQMKIKAAHAARRAAWMKKVRDEAIVGVFIVIIILTMAGTFMWVAHDRQQKYPQYGNELFPKTAQQRRQEAEPITYIGR